MTEGGPWEHKHLDESLQKIQNMKMEFNKEIDSLKKSQNEIKHKMKNSGSQMNSS